MAGRGVTTPMTARASIPVLRSMLDFVQAKNYDPAVLGVHASPDWAEAHTFSHQNVPVRIEPCVSALAVREAVLSHKPGQWTVILTDRTDEDLGTGLLSHLIGFRLRTPDPWGGVRDQFAAVGIDPALTRLPNDRDIATGLLAASPASGWQPAPGGVLTRDHALGSVAAAHLGLTDPVVDIASVLAWTADPALATRIADLRALSGDALADAVLDWTASRTGAAGPAIRHLLHAGEARDAVPLGLIVGLLGQARDGRITNETTEPDADLPRIAREALIRLEGRVGGTVPGSDVLRTWAAEATAAINAIDQESAAPGNARQPRATDAERLLTRADQLLGLVQADALADASDLLPSGLTRRLATLAAGLRAVCAPVATRLSEGTVDADVALIPSAAVHQVEVGWARVAAHRLAEADGRVPVFHAAVRLVRWLSVAASPGQGGNLQSLGALVRRHGDHDAWADSAINDAATGVSDPDLGSALAEVLSTAWARRRAHDGVFADSLAAHTRSDPDPKKAGIWHIEDLLPQTVLPLARKTPVLLLVLDGMSAGAGVEVAASILARTWAEALLPGQARRAVALAALPTLTEVSRASLLTGHLAVGGQDAERSGFEALTRAHGLPHVPLFHKRPLDSTRPGYAIAADVAAAIDDTERHSLVACILNTIDDALDRSDPGGIAWGTETVKHLLPLLDRARNAGRVVVLTADHGHVIERRQGTQRTYTGISSSRSRPAAPPAEAGEIALAGRRMLLHDGSAVLAVNENLRYGPLKAGYHGGGAPSEAIVPVTVFVPGAVPEESGLVLAPPQEPAWWLDPAALGDPAEAATLSLAPDPALTRRSGRREPTLRKRPEETMPTLFDDAEPGTATSAPQPPAGTEGPAPAAATAPATAAGVLKSSAYVAQKKIAGRVSVTDGQVSALLSALLGAPGQRLAPAAAATALQIAPALLRGAVLHVQRLLNVEGYAVLRIDADGATLILDEALLREQYGIGV